MKHKLSKISVYSYLIDAIHIDAKIFEISFKKLKENNSKEFIDNFIKEYAMFDKDETFQYYIDLFEKGNEEDVKEVIEYIEEMHRENHYHNYIDLGITYKWRPL